MGPRGYSSRLFGLWFLTHLLLHRFRALAHRTFWNWKSSAIDHLPQSVRTQSILSLRLRLDPRLSFNNWFSVSLYYISDLLSDFACLRLVPYVLAHTRTLPFLVMNIYFLHIETSIGPQTKLYAIYRIFITVYGHVMIYIQCIRLPFTVYLQYGSRNLLSGYGRLEKSAWQKNRSETRRKVFWLPYSVRNQQYNKWKGEIKRIHLSKRQRQHLQRVLHVTTTRTSGCIRDRWWIPGLGGAYIGL